MTPRVDEGFDILVRTDFRQAFNQHDDGTLVSHNDDRVAFKVSKRFIESGIAIDSFRDIMLEGLCTLAFLMAIWFSLALHRQCSRIKGVHLNNRYISQSTLLATDNHIWPPSLGHLLFNILLLIVRHAIPLSTTTFYFPYSTDNDPARMW
ncbi:hypothetical protein [Salinicoccus sp. RF5]|uniref:hypothetical protein n=1 Tax=Salinicoccus sp. RF5 TaxID=2748874 RepID=UPI001E3E3122|nr:hypothetical protein [Salinicoccus sp. RF5]MCC4722353.1 hypothetical protein [Salinicoccus sp. RF5]